MLSNISNPKHFGYIFLVRPTARLVVLCTISIFGVLSLDHCLSAGEKAVKRSIEATYSQLRTNSFVARPGIHGLNARFKGDGYERIGTGDSAKIGSRMYEAP